MEIKNESKHIDRVDWIDLAKGICIFLVVFHHTNNYCYHEPYLLSSFFMSFRMPLYFVLSGLFFKPYPLKVFLAKKTNKLLIPYLFFFLTLCFSVPLLLDVVFNYHIPTYTSNGWCSLLRTIFQENLQADRPIWFLQCLFIMNMIFYVVVKFSQIINKEYIIYVILCVMGGGGLFCSNHFHLPCFFDTALTAMPFFGFGYALRRHSHIFDSTPQKIDLLYVMLLGVFVYMASKHQFYGYVVNCYSGWKSILSIYPCGIAGTMMVLLFARLVRHIPVISYCGRYSIMILCTHAYVIFFFYSILINVNIGNWYKIMFVTIATIIISLILIPLMKKMIPYFTAQSDIIPISK